MKVLVQTPTGQVLELEPDDPNENMAMIKILISSKDVALGELRLWYEGREITDDATLGSIQYKEGTKLSLAQEAESGALTGRAGDVPMTGFASVQIVVAGVANELTNGVYVPAPPHNGKPVWYKAPSEEEPAEGESKDRGERCIYYFARQEKWFMGDELDAGGFAFVPSWGQCIMPVQTGWNAGASLEFKGAAADGDLHPAAALTELTHLSGVEPWADQETCYNTMLKVLGNIASNPGEAKFCSIKVDNAAIQNKILKHNGARGFLEAVGFRDTAGALTLPPDRHGQAAQARELLQGFAVEANYRQIRKERHAQAAEEIKKAAAAPKRPAPKAEEGGQSGPRFGRDRGSAGG